MITSTYIKLNQSLGSTEFKIFIALFLLHLLLQVPLNLVLPFPNYSELSMGDASAYYPISEDLFPEEPQFSPNKYRRILLPLIVRVFFPWNRYLGFLLVGVVAVSIASVIFYKIAKKYTRHPMELTLLFAGIPYLFASAHLGYSEPLMVALLLAGFYDLTEGKVLRSSVWFAMALLAKEIAIVPVLALIFIQALNSRYKNALLLSLSLLPAIFFYLFLGFYWENPLWLLGGDLERFNIGFTPLIILDLLRDPVTQSYVPPSYLVLNQLANIALFILLILAIIWLKKERALQRYVWLSSLPLLFLGWAVVFLNWHVGRQALIIIPLAILGFDRIMPRLKPYLWPILIIMLMASIFQSLYWAKFFWFYKF